MPGTAALIVGLAVAIAGAEASLTAPNKAFRQVKKLASRGRRTR